ncbi:hypothetical protein V6N13_086904 [Hibiscus sabdariffa]
MCPNIVIGREHDNDESFDDKNTSGIIGLECGDVSSISQLVTTIAGKFSHCLLPLSEARNSSKTYLGSNAIVSGNRTVSTWLTKQYSSTFYFLTLELISVETNIVIDSNTTLPHLPD